MGRNRGWRAVAPLIAGLALGAVPLLAAPEAQAAKGGSNASKPAKPSKPKAGQTSGVTTASFSTPSRGGGSGGGVGVLP